MNLKVKLFKKFTSILCAISMSTSFVITSAGAVNTNYAEAVYSQKYINSLPKPEDENFDKYSGKYERDEVKVKDKKYTDTLSSAKQYDVKYPENKYKYKIVKKENEKDKKIYDGYKIVQETINEKEIYHKINATVQKIKKDVKDTKTSNYNNMPEDMRVAEAIYRWVATNIPYDYDSLAKGKDQKKGENASLRKPQDPFFVFNKKTGVCAGKANLINLMMKLAGIPSIYLVSDTHAFNAVYLKDKSNTRNGWVLLDATWGTSDSYNNIQANIKANKDMVDKQKEKINAMIQGKATPSSNFMLDTFAMDDEHSKEIDEIISPIYFEPVEISDDKIESINQKLAEKLKELNANCSSENSFILNKIKITKDENGQFLIEYKTNVEQDKAEEFYQNAKKRHIENKAKKLIEEFDEKLFKNDFKKLNVDFTNKINKKIYTINKLHNRNKLKNCKNYCNEFQIFFDALLTNYKNELKNNINDIPQSEEKVTEIINKMNTEIENEINTLSNKYPDIIKIQSLTIKLDKSNLNAKNIDDAIKSNIKLDLPLENAIEYEKNRSKIKEFFLGFYDQNISFEDANENIISCAAHKIIGKDMIIDGVMYEMLGQEGDKVFKLTGDGELDNVKIPPDMINLGVPFNIGKGIHSLILQGNEQIIINNNSSYLNLNSVNADQSTRYISDEIGLYRKNEDGSKGKIEHIFNTWGEFNKIRFYISANDQKTEIKKIEINNYNDDDVKTNVKLPKYLTQFNIPIKIGQGIKSLILENDDIVDFSEAKDLKSINITNSNKYIIEDNILYEKSSDGKKGPKVNAPKLNFENMLQKYEKEICELYNWKDYIYLDDKYRKEIRNSNSKTSALAEELKEKFDDKKVDEFIQLAKNSIEIMKKYKNEKFVNKKLKADSEARNKKRKQAKIIMEKYEQAFKGFKDKLRWFRSKIFKDRNLLHNETYMNIIHEAQKLNGLYNEIEFKLEGNCDLLNLDDPQFDDQHIEEFAKKSKEIMKRMREF